VKFPIKRHTVTAETDINKIHISREAVLQTMCVYHIRLCNRNTTRKEINLAANSLNRNV